MDTLKVYAARSEIEVVRCVLEGGRKGYETLSFRVKQRKARIPAPTVYRMPEWAGYPKDMLVPAVGTPVAPGEALSLYLAFKMPGDMKADTYFGEFEILSGEKVVARVPLRLEVFPLSVPDTPPRPYLVDVHGETNERVEQLKALYEVFGLQPLWLNTELSDADMAQGASPLFLGADSYKYGNGLPNRPVMVSYDLANARTSWTDSMIVMAQWGAEDPAPARMVRGGLYPDWQAHVEHLAAPLAAWDDVLLGRAQSGHALLHSVPMDVQVSSETESAVELAWSLVESGVKDAVDGSRSTVWYTQDADGETGLELVLGETIELDALTLYLTPGATVEEIAVRTSVDEQSFSAATVKWSVEQLPNGVEKHVGTLVYTHWAKVVDVVVLYDGEHAPLGIQEIVLNNEDTAALPGKTVKPWLEVLPGVFPATESGKHPLNVRIIPWIAEQLQMAGVTGMAWNRGVGIDEALWVEFESQFYPTLRLFEIRNGWEDLRYCAIKDAGGDGHLRPADLPVWWKYSTISRTLLDEIYRDMEMSRIVRGRNGEEE